MVPRFCVLLSMVALVIGGSAQAASPRDTLIRAAFATPQKALALTLVNEAIAETDAELARNPADREAKLQNALGIGYRGQLTRSLGDAKTTHRLLQAFVAANPRDPEAQVAIAGWHLTAVAELGPMMASAILGASKTDGLAALDRAVALGGNRAFFPAYAALIRIRVDPDDTAAALRLAKSATTSAAPQSIDRIMQRAAARLIGPLGTGDGKTASKLAKLLLPFGAIS